MVDAVDSAVLSTTALGALLALLGALGWAGQYLCIRLGTERGSVREAMVVSLAVNVAVVAPAAVVTSFGAAGLTPLAVGAFAAAGVAGSWLSRLLQFRSTKAVGAARTAPVVSANALVAAGLAAVFLDESLTPAHVLGIVLIVAGVSVVSWETADRTASGSVRLRALSLPVAAALCLGVEPVFLTVGFDQGTPLLVGLAVMSSTAAVGYVGTELLRDRSLLARAFTAPDRRWYVGAGLTGTVALLGYFAALSVARVSVVVPILQTAPVLVVALSALVLPSRLERVTRPVVAAAIVVAVGTVLVSMA